MTDPAPLPIDHERIERAVREILEAIGEDPDRDGLARTPTRIANMYEEIFAGLHEDPSHHLTVTFEADHDEMVMVRDIPIHSVCEHHLIPFAGRAHVAYIPGSDGRITGLSKIARLVDGFAKRPQVQERLTTQIADAIVEVLNPSGALVMIEAEHFCMSMRGVKKPGSLTITSAVRGLFKTQRRHAGRGHEPHHLPREPPVSDERGISGARVRRGLPISCVPMFAWSSVCGERPAVMGIVNVTPDSFSDGGRFLDPGAAVAHGLALVAAGADLLDVGGESTRPGAEPVTEAEELRRVVPVVARLSAEAGVPVSIDTSKSAVAAAALEAGAVVVNDVTAATGDGQMFPVVAAAAAGVVLMHMQGDPRTMQQAPAYDDVVVDVADFLAARVARARDAGIDSAAICVDPGFGFGKTAAHNLALLARLDEVVDRVDVPLLVGTSRKSFIGAVLGDGEHARDDGTLASVVWAVDRGARVVRVHDAGAAADALRLLDVMTAIDAVAVA